MSDTVPKQQTGEGFWAGVTTAVAAVGGTLEHLVEDVEGTLDGVMGVKASEIKEDTPEKTAPPTQPADEERSKDEPAAAPAEEQPTNEVGWKKLFGGIVDTIHEVATDLITDDPQTPSPPSPSPQSPSPEHTKDANPSPEEETAVESEPMTPPRYPTVLKAQSPAESVSDSAGTDKKIDELVAEWTSLTAEGDADTEPLPDIVQEIEMQLALDGAVQLETLNKMGRTTAVRLHKDPSDTSAHEEFLTQVESIESLAYATLLSPVRSTEPQSPSSISDRNNMDILRRGVTVLREAVSLFYSRVLTNKETSDPKPEG